MKTIENNAESVMEIYIFNKAWTVLYPMVVSNRNVTDIWLIQNVRPYHFGALDHYYTEHSDSVQ